MPEGLDEAQDAFSREVAPAERPRDQQGRFVATPARPEKMFEPRPLEGDPLTGDMRDGGADPRFVAREKELADGWARSDEGDEGQVNGRVRQAEPRDGVGVRGDGRQESAARARPAAADDGYYEGFEAEPERLGAQEPEQQDQDAQRRDKRQGAEAAGRDAEGQPELDAAPKYRVTTLEGQPVEKFEVSDEDGRTHEISLDEALKGYAREETYRGRMGKVTEAARAIEAEIGRITAARDQLQHAYAAYEQDLAALMPQEPNWDELYKANPGQAHELQKQYGTVYGKLSQVRQARAQMMQQAQAEAAQKAEKYAVDEFSAFVMENKIPDEPTLRRELDSMRRTARSAGFSEAEVASVYDRRMLTLLRKASKYDRMVASQPKPVPPDRGRTLTPGAASPPGTNSTRRSFDDAQKRLAQSGKLDDAAAVFQRMLR